MLNSLLKTLKIDKTERGERTISAHYARLLTAPKGFEVEGKNMTD